MDEKEFSETLSNAIRHSVVLELHKTLAPWETNEQRQMENAIQNNSTHEVQTILINALVRNLTTNQYAMKMLMSAVLERMTQVSRSM